MVNEAFPVIDVTAGRPIHLLDITPTHNGADGLSSDSNGIRRLAGVFQRRGLGPISISSGSMDLDAFRTSCDVQTSRSLTKLGNDLPIRSLLCRFRRPVVYFDLRLQTSRSSIVFTRADSTETLFSSALCFHNKILCQTMSLPPLAVCPFRIFSTAALAFPTSCAALEMMCRVVNR